MDTGLIALIRRTRMYSAYLVLSFLPLFPCRGADTFSVKQTHVTPCHVYLEEHITISMPQLGCVSPASKFSLIGVHMRSYLINGVTAGVSKCYSGRPSLKDEDVLCLPGLFSLAFLSLPRR